MSGVNRAILDALEARLAAFLAGYVVTGKVRGAVAKDATTIPLKDLSREWFVGKGHTLTIDGRSYTAQALAASTSREMSVVVSPGLAASVSDGTAVVITAATSRWSRINEPFDPMDTNDAMAGEYWVRSDVFPGRPTPLTVGAGGGMNQHSGFFLVDLFFPLGTAVSRRGALVMADALASWFLAGSTLTSDGVSILVSASASQQFREEPGWYRTEVRVDYLGYAVNA